MFEPIPERRRLPSVGRATRALVVVGIVVLILTAVFAALMFVQVQVGYALVLSDPWFRKDVSPVVGTGPTWYMKMPWEQPILIFYQTDTYEAVIPCFSKDQLEVKIQVLLRWSLNPAKIRELYLKYPRLDYENVAIKSITEETIRLITKKYTTVDTISLRDVVAQEIENAILNALKNEPSLASALTSVEFDLKNIEYPITYTRAIEQKLVKEQEKIAAEFERERTLILANATAQKYVLEALGQAQARLIIAGSTKEAIQLIIESAGMTNTTDTSKIAQLYLSLETLRQIAPEIGVLIVGGSGVPMILQIPQNP